MAVCVLFSPVVRNEGGAITRWLSSHKYNIYSTITAIQHVTVHASKPHRGEMEPHNKRKVL